MAKDASPEGIFRQWVVACTLGEVVGFCAIPVVLGTVSFALSGGLAEAARALLLFAVAVLGGLAEGAVLALFQYRVLSRVLTGLPRVAWIRATAVAASLAWAVGMAIPTLDELVGLAPAVQTGLWIAAGILILLSIGFAQSRVLARAGIARPSSWIFWNVGGWLAGLPWTFVLPALLPDASPVWAFGVAMAVGGVLMGASLGLVTAFKVRAWARSTAIER
jgi:hypothetical protein